MADKLIICVSQRRLTDETQIIEAKILIFCESAGNSGTSVLKYVEVVYCYQVYIIKC